MAALLLVPAIFLGLHFHSRWPRSARAAFLVLLCGVSAAYGAGLASLIVERTREQPEWDFLGFWLHARSAAAGLDFYDPRSAQALAAPYSLSDSFRQEIVDVGFWYPPPSMFLFLPLGWLDRATALSVWYAGMVAAALAATALLWRTFFVRARSTELAACLALVCAAHGTWLTFYFSQTSFVALAALLLFWRRRDSAAGGAWAAIALFVKPFLVAPAAAPFFARRWRAVAGWSLGIAALCAASLAAFGARAFTGYFAAGPAGGKPWWVYTESTNQSLLGFSLRLRGAECDGAGCIADPAFLAAAALIGAVTVFLAARLARDHGEWALALLLSCALLIYPVSQVFYSVLLIPVWLLLWRERARAGGPWAVAMGCGAIYALCAVDQGHATVAAFAATWVAVTTVGFRLLARRDQGSS